MDFRENVFTITTFKEQVNVKFPKRTFSFTTEQIPISISTAATMCKLQGETVEAIFVSSPRARGETKASSLSALLLLYNLNMMYLDYFMQTVSLLFENDWLEKMGERTFNEYSMLFSKANLNNNEPSHTRMMENDHIVVLMIMNRRRRL